MKLKISILLLAAVFCLGIREAGAYNLPEKAGSPAKKCFYPSPGRKHVDPFWERAWLEVYNSGGGKRQSAKATGKGYDVLYYGDPHKKDIALTFDDGPHPEYTPQILRILKKYKIKATFFLVGMMAERRPDLVKAISRDNHLVGNHSFHHQNLVGMSKKRAEAEWLACNNVIKSILGKSPQFCRPPGGDYNDAVFEVATKRGLTTVLWTDDPGDYSSPGREFIERNILNYVYNGSIILLHDGVQQTINVLPQIIEGLNERGYRFVTVETMENDWHKK